MLMFAFRMWGTGVIRADQTMLDYINGVGGQDVNSAINTCKALMNAVKYVSPLLARFPPCTYMIRICKCEIILGKR